MRVAINNYDPNFITTWILLTILTKDLKKKTKKYFNYKGNPLFL